jgi:acetoin utilization protein AcuB
MFVKDYMTRHPILIEPNKRVVEAQKLMGENKIRHIPVVGDGKRLLGLVTPERLQIPPGKLHSLDVWEITRYLSNLTVEKVMLKGPDLRTIGPDATLEDAADLLHTSKIGGLPVIADDVVVGVITETDLLGEFTRLSGAMAENGWGIMAMGSVRSPKVPDHWDIVMKVRGCSNTELMPVLESIEGQQVLDVRETSVYTN